MDVGPSMSLIPPGGESCHLAMALKIVNQIVQQKVRFKYTGHIRTYMFVTCLFSVKILLVIKSGQILCN